MCSIPGLRSPGSAVSVLINKVNLNPHSVLVELWANLEPERKPIYQQMRRQIQFPRERFCDSEGSPGDLCLVQIFETWYRARILSIKGPNYSLSLLDEGRTLHATANTLAWGSSDLFLLPPEVEFCVLANVLPLSTEHKWSPMALEFLTSLSGKAFDGFIEDMLVPHRAFLLDIPSISTQMYEMGFAKKLTVENFKLFLSTSFQPASGLLVFADPVPISSSNAPDSFHKQNEKLHSYFYPELEARTVETVIVTEVTNPLRLFCQLKVFSQELRKLTDQMTHYYEERTRMRKVWADLLGLPCAARDNDGRWHRSILQQVLPSSIVGEVLHVDNGKKDFVQIENVRPLAAEFLRMPVVTYVCSLHGIANKGTGWKTTQIEYLKSLVLHRTVIAKFEYQSLSEGVHYVTLYGEGNMNINHCFGTKERCLLENEKSLQPFAVGEIKVSPLQADSTRSEMQSPVTASVLQDIHVAIPVKSLAVHSSHVAVVQHVNNPSEFWIRTQEYDVEFDQMMHGIGKLFQNSTRTEGHLKNLTVGLLCAARLEDDNFHRAVICEVIGKHAKAYFVDYGHVGVVDWYNLRALPSEYHKLPAFALKCALTGIRPKGGKWSHSANVYFLKVVESKVVNVYVSAKSQNLHIVQLTDSSATGENNINKMLCNAGLADDDDDSKNELQALAKKPLIRTLSGNNFDMDKDDESTVSSVSCATLSDARAVFSQLFFPVGSSVEVNVSFVESPSDFWCQLAQNAGTLKLLMEDLQNYYANVLPQPPTEAACAARSPKNGMWYRGLIIERRTSSDVDVLLIDYGPTQKIPLEDLRPLNPAFLKLKGQAFRCSLYSLICPVDYSSEWSRMAKLEFQDFVDSAASSNVRLKCIINAVTHSSQNVLFNVVDLGTPFQSVCSLLVQKGLARRGLPRKEHIPPVLIDRYCHSSHIKTGGEEMVQVTSVENVNRFYCQLERNSDMAEKLMKKVNSLCLQLQHVNCPKTFGTLCFVKYADGLWYRGLIKSVNPVMQVHLVDYGDNIEADESDMIPIPVEAGEIMSVPVLAVECGLSDIPEGVSSEVNGWFKEVVTDHCFKAVVVAKEQCGKLMVELYDGKMQLNLMIKRKIDKPKGYASHSAIIKPENTQDPAYRQAWAIQRGRNPPKQTEPNQRSMKFIKAIESEVLLPKKQDNAKNSSSRVHREPVVVPERHEKWQCQKLAEVSAREHEEDWEGHTSELSNIEEKRLPNVAKLPLKFLRAGQVSEVYVSHVNTPSSFFVQMAEDEDKIYSVTNELNGHQPACMFGKIDRLQEGDLVSALFPGDGCRYRAVVQNVVGSCTVQVEFVDFGNNAPVSPSEICRLDPGLIMLPRLSIHCMLNKAAFGKDIEWDQEYVTNFKRVFKENESKKLKCLFVEQVGSVWEVVLETQLTNVLEYPVVTDGSMLGSSEKHETPLLYTDANISEGRTFEMYASCIVSPQCFWCQYANTNDLQMILEAAAEVGNALDSEALWAESLSPGSPCLALYEDEQWYRAEVLAKSDKGLSIIFVDYGNECDVDINKVKQVPPQLLEAPPQAFLCLLNGFDPSEGTWNEHAVDQFSSILEDEVLKITVVKVKQFVDHKTPSYQVNVECKGQLINDIMMAYWRLYTLADCSLHADKECVTVEVIAASESTSMSLPSLHLEETTHAVKPEESLKEIGISSTDYIIQGSENQGVPGHSAHDTELSELHEQLENFRQPLIVAKQTCDKEDLVVVCASSLENILSEVTAEESNCEKPEEGKEVESPQSVTEKCPLESDFISIESSMESITIESLSEEGQTCSSITKGKVGISEVLNKVETCLRANETSSSLVEPVQDGARGADELAAGLLNDTQDALLESDHGELKDEMSYEQNLEVSGSNAGPVLLLSEDSEAHVGDGQDTSMSPFGKLQAFENEPVIGSDCFFWSHEFSMWCSARITNLLDDSVKVLLLDSDVEAIVNMTNIFRRLPEDLPQDSNSTTPLDEHRAIGQGSLPKHCEESDESTDSATCL